jgi:Flp pilus assembly protein TadG
VTSAIQRPDAMLKPVSFIKNDEGGAMAEFAIASTVFIIILLGILEFGYAAWAKNDVAADAREGARWAMVRGGQSGARVATDPSVSTYVKSKSMLGNSITVTTNWEDPVGKAPGTTVAVTVSHFVPRRGPFLADHTDVSTSTMLIVY